MIFISQYRIFLSCFCYWLTLLIYTDSIKHEGCVPIFMMNNLLLHNLLILDTMILVTKQNNIILWKDSTSFWWPALHLYHTDIRYNISEIRYLHSCIKLIAQLNLNRLDNSLCSIWMKRYIYIYIGRLFISRQKQSFISLTKNVKHFEINFIFTINMFWDYSRFCSTSIHSYRWSSWSK